MAIEDFVSASPTANDFRVPEFPKLADHLGSLGQSDGARRYDQATSEWRTQLERQILERLKAISST